MSMQLELQGLLGFRFMPSDKELLSNYLIPKITGENQFRPGTVVPHIPVIDDLYLLTPIEIMNRVNIRVDGEFIYVFTKLKKFVEGGEKIVRSKEDKKDDNEKGKTHWRTQKAKDVKLNNGEIGKDRPLSYSIKGTDGGVESLSWIVHEFSLPSRGSDWVICRMHFNSKRRRNGQLSGSSGCSALSSFQQSPLEQLPPPQPPTPPPPLVSYEDQIGATSEETCEQIIINPAQEIQYNNQGIQINQPHDENLYNDGHTGEGIDEDPFGDFLAFEVSHIPNNGIVWAPSDEPSRQWDDDAEYIQDIPVDVMFEAIEQQYSNTRKQ